VRRLVVNADDFGLTSGINRAVIEGHASGVITSATLMAKGAGFDEAVQMALQAPALSVGCHVVLVDGTPVLPHGQVPSLASADTQAFPRTFAEFMRMSRRFSEAEIEAEFTAQIRKLQLAGIAVSHIDAHKHTHVFPQILAPMLRAAQACGVAAVRAPFEPPGSWRMLKRPALWKRSLAAWSFRRYASAFRLGVQKAGLTAPEGCLGIIATGALDAPLLAEIIAGIPEGTWEFVCHPGYVDEELKGIRTRLRESRAAELRLLTSSATRQLLAKNNIELVSYRELGKTAASIRQDFSITNGSPKEPNKRS
jgi:hopanoid biosynthesis associated protein HpnK